jgi:hypothetical protein
VVLFFENSSTAKEQDQLRRFTYPAGRHRLPSMTLRPSHLFNVHGTSSPFVRMEIHRPDLWLHYKLTRRPGPCCAVRRLCQATVGSHHFR